MLLTIALYKITHTLSSGKGASVRRVLRLTIKQDSVTIVKRFCCDIFFTDDEVKYRSEVLGFHLDYIESDKEIFSHKISKLVFR